MTLIASQQRVLAVHDCFRRGVDPRDGTTPISLVESNGNNVTWITEFYTQLTGAGNGLAWCAQGCSVGAYLAHVMDVPMFSMGAWNLIDKLKAAGLGLDHPEPGCLAAFSEGSGHITTMLANPGGTTWVAGDSNWGDRYQWVTRDMSAQPIYGYARLPGVDAEMKALAHPDTPPPPAPPAPFAGHPIVQWTGHAQVWHIAKEWVLGHGWRYTKAQIPPGQLATVEKHAGQGVFHIGDVGAVRLKKLHTVNFAGA